MGMPISDDFPLKRHRVLLLAGVRRRLWVPGWYFRVWVLVKLRSHQAFQVDVSLNTALLSGQRERIAEQHQAVFTSGCVMEKLCLEAMQFAN